MTEKEIVLVVDGDSLEPYFVAPTFKDAINIIVEKRGAGCLCHLFPQYTVEELKEKPYEWWTHNVGYDFFSIKFYE